MIFDEFTSVVDREVAENLSMSLAKTVRAENMQFIAVSCHNDICDWLEPDWGIRHGLAKHDRPKTFKRSPRTFTIQRCGRDTWRNFSRYHYLTTSLNQSARCYGLYFENRQIGICATTFMPRSNGIAMKRIHRIVIHPDWQGIGLGKRFATLIAQHEAKTADCFLQTSSPAMKHALLHHENWELIRNSFTSGIGATSTRVAMMCSRRKVKTASFVIRKTI